MIAEKLLPKQAFSSEYYGGPFAGTSSQWSCAPGVHEQYITPPLDIGIHKLGIHPPSGSKCFNLLEESVCQNSQNSGFFKLLLSSSIKLKCSHTYIMEL